MWLMLLVVGVGLCVDGQWSEFGGGRRLVSLTLTARVCSRWCGALVMPLVRVVQAMPQVMLWVRVVLVAPVVWVLLVTAWWMARCGCFGGEGVVIDGSGRVPLPPLAEAWWFVCFTGCCGIGCLWCRRLPVATLVVGWCWRLCC